MYHSSCYKVAPGTNLISTFLRRAAHSVVPHDGLVVASTMSELIKDLGWPGPRPVTSTLCRTSTNTGNDGGEVVVQTPSFPVLPGPIVVSVGPHAAKGLGKLLQPWLNLEISVPAFHLLVQVSHHSRILIWPGYFTFPHSS